MNERDKKPTECGFQFTCEKQDTVLEQLRPAINNMLFMYLPDDATIGGADKIAMRIFEMIKNPSYWIERIEAGENKL